MEWHELTGDGAEFPKHGQRVVVRVNNKEREAVFTWTKRNYRFDLPGRKWRRGMTVQMWRAA